MELGSRQISPPGRSRATSGVRGRVVRLVEWCAWSSGAPGRVVGGGSSGGRCPPRDQGNTAGTAWQYCSRLALWAPTPALLTRSRDSHSSQAGRDARETLTLSPSRALLRSTRPIPKRVCTRALSRARKRLTAQARPARAHPAQGGRLRALIAHRRRDIVRARAPEGRLRERRREGASARRRAIGGSLCVR